MDQRIFIKYTTPDGFSFMYRGSAQELTEVKQHLLDLRPSAGQDNGLEVVSKEAANTEAIVPVKDPIENVPESIWTSCFTINHDFLLISLREPFAQHIGLVEGVLIILAAYRKIYGITDVLASSLISALSESGIMIDRLDRPLDEFINSAKWIISNKAGRGSTYSLTEEGSEQAFKILAKMVRRFVQEK